MTELHEGETFGRWALVAPVTRAAWGERWRARDDAGADAALELITDPRLTTDADVRAALTEEARFAALVESARVVRVHDAGDGATPWVASEWVEGIALEQLIARGERCGVAIALPLIADVAEALAASGVIHHRIDARAVRLSTSGAAKLDLRPRGRALARTGNAHAVDGHDLESALSRALLVHARAPRPAVPDDDVGAIGKLLLELLLGRDRASALLDAWAHRGELPRLPAELPPPVRDVVARALGFHPSGGRFTSARELERDVRTAASAAAVDLTNREELVARIAQTPRDARGARSSMSATMASLGANVVDRVSPSRPRVPGEALAWRASSVGARTMAATENAAEPDGALPSEPPPPSLGAERARVQRCIGCGRMARAAVKECAACGGLVFAPERAELVDGRYAIEQLLGEGAMGRVYRAWDVDLGREVAMKMLNVSASRRAEHFERLRREAVALAAVRHPQVVQVYAFGRHAEDDFFVMEYVRGATLEDIVGEHARHGEFVCLERALTLLLQVAGGLDAVHASGILHRDVKPANVVVEHDTGRPVLVDFGIAHPVAQDMDNHAPAGTPAYMSPELLGGVAESGRGVDVYALGCTAFELLTNRPPFQGTSLAQLVCMHTYEAPPVPSEIRAELQPLDEVITRALAKDPDERFPGAADFRHSLEHAARGLLGASMPPPSVRRDSEVRAIASRGLRLLVVDDDPAFRSRAVMAAKLALRGVRLDVAEAATGPEAIARAAQSVPQLVVLDYDMRGLDGVATLAALRALPGGARARVLVIGDRAAGPDRWRFDALGVEDFVERRSADLVTLRRALTVLAARSGLTPRAAA